MPPKGSRAKSTARPSKLASVTAEPLRAATLVQAHEQELAAAGSKRRKLQRRDTEAAVQKSLADNFRGFTAAQTDVVLVNGLTLREKLMADKRAHKHGDQGTMGGQYYRQLRIEYSSSDPVEKILVPKTPIQPVQEEFKNALVGLQSVPCVPAKIVEWCRTAPPLNQRELCGLYKSQLLLRPSASKQQLSVCLDVMTYVHRTKMHVLFPDEAAAMEKTWDEVLVQAYLAFKNQGLPLSTFWAAHKEIGSLVLPVADVEALFAANEQWVDVEQQLQRVCSTSVVGQKMFGFLNDRLIQHKVSVEMNKFTGNLMNAVKLDEATCSQQVSACKTNIGLIPGIENLPARRVAMINYRGLSAPTQVLSIFEEIEVRWAAVVKARATETQKLEAMLFENDLVDEKTMQKHTGLDVTLQVLKNAALARATANQLVKSDSVDTEPSGQIMKEILTRKAQALQSLDRTFKLDIAFICGMQGIPGETRLQTAALECLPGPDSPLSTEASLTKLGSLLASPLFAFCGKGAQNKVAIIKGLVSSIHKQCRPILPVAENNTFVTQCALRLSYFAEAVVKTVEGEEVTVYGAEAVDALFRQLQHKVEVLKVFDLSDLQIPGKFHWLLFVLHADLLKTWTKTLLGGLAACSLVEDDKAEKDKKAIEKKRKNKSDATSLVNSFF